MIDDDDDEHDTSIVQGKFWLELKINEIWCELNESFISGNYYSASTLPKKEATLKKMFDLGVTL